MAHELKHILDAPLAATTYACFHQSSRGAQVESICDHFAACLLMPKRWVKSLWGQGSRSTAALAEQFEVSPQAMYVRLRTLGLIDDTPRCGRAQRFVGTQRKPFTSWRKGTPGYGWRPA